nr:alcohol dehydrogenase-like 1 [Ipomoea batatas]
MVESVGENVDEVATGDMVIPVFRRNCGECRDCRFGKGNVCTKFAVRYPGGMPRDGTSRFKDKDGQSIHHLLSVSSFSQYTVVDITHVVKMNPDFPIDMACLLSCGVTTGIGAAWKVAKIEEGSTVAIFGLGVVGLAVAEGARLRGASKIIGVDLNPEKFELGKKFGITDFINPTTCRESSVAQAIQKMTDEGADYCFECVGLTSLMQDAFASSRQGGCTIILGAQVHGTPIHINAFSLLNERTIAGSLFGGIKAKVDIPKLAQKYMQKELNLEGFKTHEVKFQDINQAFDLLEQKKSLRCIIWMDS